MKHVFNICITFATFLPPAFSLSQPDLATRDTEPAEGLCVRDIHGAPYDLASKRDLDSIAEEYALALKSYLASLLMEDRQPLPESR